MTRPVGRPTKYSDDLQLQADEYLFKYSEVGDVIPSRVGLCCYLGISKQTSFQYEKDYPEFLATLSNIEAMQERTALNRGLDGTFNAAITKLVLSNHGYADKQGVDLTTNGKDLTPTFAGMYGKPDPDA